MTYRAIANGNYSNLAIWEVWDGSAWVAATVLPQVGDDVYANGRTVTIDIDSFASQYLNGPLAIGIAQNGTFQINDGVTAVGDFIGLGSLNNGACLTGTAGTKWVVGNIINNTSALVTNGSHGIYTTTGKFNVVGNASALSVGGGSSVNNRNLPIKAQGGQVELFGDSTSAAGNGINVGVWNLGTQGNVIIHGRATGSGGSRRGAINCIVAEIEGINENCTVTSKFIMPTTNQTAWVNCKAKAGAPVQIEIYDENNNPVVCNPLFAQDQASTADVRFGTIYANGALTGTLAVPPAGAVSLGVPVDNTVGTAAVDTDELRDQILPSILAALNNP